MTAAAPVLSIRDLNKSFGALIVAQSINVELQAGARVGLIGPNSAGKTTFGGTEAWIKAGYPVE